MENRLSRHIFMDKKKLPKEMEFKIQSAQGFFSIFNPQMKHVTQKYNSQWFTNVLSYRKRLNFQATVKSIKRKAGGGYNLDA